MSFTPPTIHPNRRVRSRSSNRRIKLRPARSRILQISGSRRINVPWTSISEVTLDRTMANWLVHWEYADKCVLDDCVDPSQRTACVQWVTRRAEFLMHTNQRRRNVHLWRGSSREPNTLVYRKGWKFYNGGECFTSERSQLPVLNVFGKTEIGQFQMAELIQNQIFQFQISEESKMRVRERQIKTDR